MLGHQVNRFVNEIVANWWRERLDGLNDAFYQYGAWSKKCLFKLIFYITIRFSF